jgi:hypothetical protein
MSRKAKYKPLLFTTTVRNPSRVKALLCVLKKYNGQRLTNNLAEVVMGEIIKYGLYRPTRKITHNVEKKWGTKRVSESSPIGIKKLSDQEVKRLLKNNPQNHKEAGFDKGWASRFATIFDFAKELGFVYYWVNEKIEFSKIGLKLAESIEITTKNDFLLMDEKHPELEQQAFLNSLVKYQRNNPFVKVLNDNVPLVLLLQVIRKINADSDFNSSGISKLELPLIIFWKNSNADELYQLIRKLRNKYGYQPTWEVIVDICVKEIMDGEFKKFKPKSIMSEYPDEFIRKMRLTGLISLRGGGRFIDINQNEITKINYVLKKYSSYPKFTSEKEYFDYASQIDDNLISLKRKKITTLSKSGFVEKWVKEFEWKVIKKEITNLANKNLSKHNILKYLPNPVRLEFLTALAIKSQLPKVVVIPNYPIDDEGVPTSTAGGTNNTGDIECFEGENCVLIEVTMSAGRVQTMMEIWPISRHLEKFIENNNNQSMCYFVAPSIYVDSLRQIDYVRNTYNLNIKPNTIKEFLEFLEKTPLLYKAV